MRFVVLRANAGDVEGLVALDEPEAAVGLANGKVAKDAQSSCRGGDCNLAALHSLDNVFI